MVTKVSFTKFFKTEMLPDDDDVIAFLKWIHALNGKHPDTSDPDLWGLFLHGRLTKEQAKGYRKLFALYYSQDNSMVNKKTYPTLEDLVPTLMMVQ